VLPHQSTAKGLAYTHLGDLMTPAELTGHCEPDDNDHWQSLVVRSIKKGEGRICLAIGDGANDVSMIQKAHVGVGIFGKEGNQAARAADYAIHQFKYVRSKLGGPSLATHPLSLIALYPRRHLKRLLCVHGRKNYIQATGLVQFFFYKNISYNLPFVWYSFFNGFSAQVRSTQRRPSVWLFVKC
jgi:magnesium-transporting ATPase (P-type)